MRIDYPTEAQLPELRRLWQSCFNDDDSFLDLFFDTAFSPDRCRCVTDGDLAAALYWLDCRCEDRPLAYLYAVATAPKRRGEGLCRALMADTHALLQKLGYAGAVLVPGEAALFQMYAGMGYEICSTVEEFECKAGSEAAPLRPIEPAEYAALRRQMLPEGAVIQEDVNLNFLAGLARFYKGEDLLLCAGMDGDKLFVPELLGSADAAPGILAALGVKSGTFRTPGRGRDFAMYHPLSDAPAPRYFGLAFD